MESFIKPNNYNPSSLSSDTVLESGNSYLPKDNEILLRKGQYLSEFKTEEEKQRARDNIGALKKGDYLLRDDLDSELYKVTAVIIKWMYNDANLVIQPELIQSELGDIIYNIATNLILYRIKDTKKIYKYWNSEKYPKEEYCNEDNTPYETKRYIYSNTFYVFDPILNILTRNKEVIEWSGIIVLDVPVSNSMAMEESDPNNIYFDSVKQTFLYKKGENYCTLWKNIYKYQRYQYEDYYFSAGFNLNAIFVGIKGPTLIAYDESRCSLIGTSSITDDKFSLTSENALQNKVITDLLIKIIRWTEVN